jgi:hypothetical protein
VGSWRKIQAPKNSKSRVLKSELQNTLDIEKGKILQTLQKQIANVWSRSNKCDNTILLTLSSTQYTMGHYTVKKSLKKSDNEKVGQRFISWEITWPYTNDKCIQDYLHTSGLALL